MKIRPLFAAPLIVISICLGMAAAQAQPMIPKPEWLVPASGSIVIADMVEQHSITSPTNPISDRQPAAPDLYATVQIAKIHVSKVILGNPPVDPIVVTARRSFSEEEDPAMSKGPMLLFLAPLDSRSLAYQLVRSLRIEKGLVPWASDTSEVRMGPKPISEVLAQLEQFIKLHPPKSSPTPESLPLPHPIQ